MVLQKPVAGAAQQQTEQLSPAADALQGTAGVVQLYRSPGLSVSQARTLLRQVQAKVSSNISGLDSELVSAPVVVCGGATPHMRQLQWLLRDLDGHAEPLSSAALPTWSSACCSGNVQSMLVPHVQHVAQQGAQQAAQQTP